MKNVKKYRLAQLQEISLEQLFFLSFMWVLCLFDSAIISLQQWLENSFPHYPTVKPQQKASAGFFQDRLFAQRNLEGQ